MTTDLDRIKTAVSIATLVEKKYKLNGHSDKYRHTQEHDSLVVNLKEQSYFWNSKGEHGDIIDWVGRHELDYNGQWNSADPTLFKEAVVWLARFAGLPEPQFRPEDPQARAQRLTQQRVMELAAEHYQNVLTRDEIQGLNYCLEIRGFSPATIQNARLGQSDGALWKTIPETDRPTAADLGLIVKKDNNKGWYDAIPRNCLVYVHYHRGQVEYMAGRVIAEKLHRNLYAPKKMYWATWPGYGKPLVVVEGQADAISLAQLGVNGLGLCGVNLVDFDPDLVKLFDPVYIWQDADDPESEAGKAWAARLKELAAALGPLVRVIQSPDGVKDANNYLLTGATNKDLADLLKTARPYLDLEIDRLAALEGLDRYNQLEPLFCHLSGLNPFDLTRYRRLVTQNLGIGQADFGRYLKAAKGTLDENEEADFAKGGQYSIEDGWTVLKTFSDDGKPKITSLANGSVRITEEVLQDDGTNDPEIEFVITGELATGPRLPAIQIPAQEYSTMKWVHKWGSRFILMAGRNTQDHFRAATQFLSGTPHRRTIYTHTGWRKINDKWIFLSANGALGGADSKIQVDLKLGRPDTNMARYALPLTPDDPAEAMRVSLNSWYITDLSITVPIWASMYLAPLLPFLSPDFGLWIHGQTGSMKSSMVAAFLSHFGQWQGKDAKIFLPSNFQSTSNSILMNAFQAKDVPFVIDDFAPGATQKEVRERDGVASNLLRSVGNKAARGRMRDGRHFQADFPPRCLAIITAEDLPKTASIMARGIGVGVTIPPKGDPARKPIEDRLTQAQVVGSYFYPHAMSAFILWVQRHFEELQRDLPILSGDYRDKMTKAGHARLPDAFGKLMAAVDTALFFAMDIGAIDQAQATARKAAAFDAMGLMMHEHGEAVESVDSTRIFQDTLSEQLDAREWWLCHVNAPGTAKPDDYPLNCQLVGFYDDHNIYLLSKTVNDIMQLYQRLGTPFPVGRNTLLKRLTEKGWLTPGADKTTTTQYIPALGTSPRVLVLKKSEVLP